jgi:hypothetical protein
MPVHPAIGAGGEGRVALLGSRILDALLVECLCQPCGPANLGHANIGAELL